MIYFVYNYKYESSSKLSLVYGSHITTNIVALQKYHWHMTLISMDIKIFLREKYHRWYFSTCNICFAVDSHLNSDNITNFFFRKIVTGIFPQYTPVILFCKSWLRKVTFSKKVSHAICLFLLSRIDLKNFLLQKYNQWYICHL